MQDVRVLHLLPDQGVGGIQRFVIELVRHERMDQASDEIVLTERPLDVERDFLAPATPAHFLGLLGESTAVRAKRLADLAESRSAQTLLVYRAADLPLALAARRHTISGTKGALRVVTQLFDAPLIPAREPRGLLGRVFGARSEPSLDLSEVDEFFVASPALLAPWHAAGATPVLRAAAVDTQRFHPQNVQSSWRSARLPDPGTLLVGSLMRAEPGKDHRVLIDAVQRRHASGRPTALMLVGDGSLYPSLREESKGSDVLFVRRRVLDAPGFFGRIDAFALHSATELIPVALLESLACGRAATVADPGGVAELVGRDAALFTPPGDVDAVIQALDRLADEAFRHELGETARKRALQNHHLGRLRSQLASSYTAAT
ncbi:glycosyltransferase [Saltatorellus ferox]